MGTTDLRRCQLQLGMYAMNLATGNTLFCRQTKSTSVKNYIQDITSFVALLCQRDICKMNATDVKFSPLIFSVYDELKRWEDVPNRREPCMLKMLEAVFCLILDTNASPNSLIAALGNWFQHSLIGGFCLTEYAQPGCCSDPQYPVQNHCMETRGFCLGDIQFAAADHMRLSAVQATRCTHSPLRKCWVKLHTQKNDSNGEERLFTANPNPVRKCFVCSILAIVERFLCLRGEHDFNTPLALHPDKRGQMAKLIHLVNIEALMRHVAAQLYKLCPTKDKEELQHWSAHSLRVGACVILHSMCYTDTQIKWHLCWRLDAFMVYLRHLAILANRQHATLDKAASMPHFP